MLSNFARRCMARSKLISVLKNGKGIPVPHGLSCREKFMSLKSPSSTLEFVGSNIKTLNTIHEKCFHACGCRCCKVELHGTDTSIWDEIELKIVECIRNTLDRRIQYYEEEVRKLSENRFLPAWNFCNFFIVKVTYGLFSTQG